ncbi:putative uracil-DNA glycosylase [Podospora australis]|uniref:Uracil-DNA glycosylase n=1 Tax=Podospora australis TaxID=1536484 RepID=A0AAN7ANH3_9PEZI|nr:putative uracil-DNA glycosylase [Podospora australis]
MSTLKRKAMAQAGDGNKKTKQDGNIMSFFGGASNSSAKEPPTTPERKTAAAPLEAAGPKFDKEKWVATLTDEQKKLLQLEIDTLHESWLVHLKDEIVSKEFLDLKRFLEREYAAKKQIFPPKEDIYSWSRHTPFNAVRVVILGQDPYHNVNQAHGLAFSVRPPTPAPPSLRNMYICLAKDYPSFTPPPNKGGLLTPWAERGVLMLNACLTVRAHDANSHSNHGWERFTQKVIDLVATKRTRGVVFMAWGTPAGKRVVKVDGKKHLVLKSVHPSPLSASRGFFTCGHFRLANEWLEGRYGAQGRVDWALIEGTSVFAEDGTPKQKTPKGKEEEEEERRQIMNSPVKKAVEAVVKATVVGVNLNAVNPAAAAGTDVVTTAKRRSTRNQAAKEGNGENVEPEDLDDLDDEEWDNLLRERGL